jgi:hypothetical protein
MRDVDESLPVGKWAYGLMGAFLVCLISVSWAAAVDWQNRSAIEKITQPTAVGDPVGIVFDPRADPAKEALRWTGISYYPLPDGVVLLPESNALKVGTDDSGKIRLYRDSRQMKGNQILVKIGPNQFLRLSPK